MAEDEADHRPETVDAALLATIARSGDPAKSQVLTRLQEAYKEVLDATKHQDDKIGRIFTGVSFLTAAALAIANLKSAELLFRKYADLPDVPLAVVSLGIYLLLVILCVTLLISSLATPLRLPGLNHNGTSDYRPAYIEGVRASQIYFGHIARLPLSDWNRKWVAIAGEDNGHRAYAELSQSLVLETHNLAARTQFKSNRTSEAIVIFKFALMFLAITAVLCIAASLTPASSPLPWATQWAVSIVIASYVFLHFQDQIRYSRQTVDEIRGWQNTGIAALRYGWTLCAASWALCCGTGLGDLSTLLVLVFGGGLLLTASIVAERKRNKVKGWREDWPHWAAPTLAILVGTALSIWATTGPDYAPLASAAGGALAITMFALITPTLTSWRDAKRAGS